MEAKNKGVENRKSGRSNNKEINQCSCFKTTTDINSYISTLFVL